MLTIIVLLALATLTLAQDSCVYTVHGGELVSNSIVHLADTNTWLLSSDGLTLVFNETVTLHSVMIESANEEMRTNLVVMDRRNGMISDMHMNIPSNGVRVTLPPRSQLDMLTIEGVPSLMEGDRVEVVACSTACHHVERCYGDCRLVVQGQCMTCLCPKDSRSSGCNGHSSQRDLHLLYALAKRRTPGCQFVNGFRRSLNATTATHTCQPFSHPRCEWYTPIVIPRTKRECETNCRKHL